MTVERMETKSSDDHYNHQVEGCHSSFEWSFIPATVWTDRRPPMVHEADEDENGLLAQPIRLNKSRLTYV